MSGLTPSRTFVTTLALSDADGSAVIDNRQRR